MNRNLHVKKISIKQESTINCSYCQICLELQFMLFLLYFLHVMFSNHIQLILFLFSGGEEEEQGGEVQQRPKSPASDCIREKNVCNIYILLNIVELNVFLLYTREEDGRTRREMRRGRRGLRRGTRKRKKRKEKRKEKWTKKRKKRTRRRYKKRPVN